MLMLATRPAAGQFETPVAVTGVHIHTSAGQTIESGTIVMADGLIVDAGADVEIPPDAQIIDATGLHAYPAFIDAYSRMGMPDEQRTEAERERLEDEAIDQAQAPLPATRLANRRGVRPQMKASELYNPNADNITAHHRQGFGSVLAVPQSGILGGYSALINVSDAPIRRSVVLEDPAQHASFTIGEPGEYPATLLGVAAVFRQFYADANWYWRMQRYLERHPRSGERLPADPALAAMMPVVGGQKPIIFEADTESDILRALALAEELDFRVWIAGGKEAYKVVDLLKSRRVPVIVNLDFDDEPDFGAKPDGNSNGEPAALEGPFDPVKVQRDKRRRWEEQVGNLNTLFNAGVVAAIGSFDLDSPDELIKQVRLAIRHGLAPQRALAALTANPAWLLGASEKLGGIDRGLLANAVLMTAPFEDENAKVKWMFVDGRRFEYDVEDKDEARAKDKEDDEKPHDVAFVPGADWRSETETDRKPQRQTGGTVLITGATVLTISGDEIAQGDVLIEDGRITAVGTNIRPPVGINVIDAAGLYVMPGIVDCHSHIALYAANEWPLAISAEVRVADVIDHRQIEIYRALAGGVTTIHTMHGSANPIGGQNAVLKLRYGKRPQDMFFDGAPRMIKFALGENVTHAHASERGKRFPNTRMGVESVMRQALIAANEYRIARQAHEALLAQGADPAPPRPDLRLETLAAVLTGDIYVHCHCYRSDEILRLFSVAEDFGFRIAVLHHVLEGYRVAPEIARHGCGASTFSNDWAYKIEAVNGIPYNAAMMTRDGVNTSVNSDSENTIRYLNIEAGKSLRWGGLPVNDALRLITLHPAQQLGVDNRVGSIEVGKDGDVAIFNGHPLDSFSKCVMTLIDGEVYFEHPLPQRNAPAYAVAPAPQDNLTPEPGAHALYAIINTTVHPISSPPIENGRVVIRNDRIDAVGADVIVPPGAVVIDAAGGHVYPGLIDAGSTLGLSEILLEAATRDESEIARIQPELRAASAINPFSEHIRTARCSGITTTLVRPDRGWLRGQSAIVDLAGWTLDDMQHGGDFALHIDLPVLPPDLPKDDRKKRTTEHEEQLREINDFFERAKLYARVMETPDAPRHHERDLRLESMIPYIRGDRPVVFHANTYKEIIESIDFAAKHELRCVISGGSEAWKCADRLANENIPVIIAKVTNYPRGDYEPFDSVYACAATLDAAGVRYAFGSDSASDAFNLPIDVGLAVANGLAPERAIYGLTLGAADLLGIAGEVGSLEAGKAANLIVTTGSPIQVSSAVTCVFIRGKPIELTSIHTENRDRLSRRPEPKLPPAPELVGPPAFSRQRK